MRMSLRFLACVAVVLVAVAACGGSADSNDPISYTAFDGADVEAESGALRGSTASSPRSSPGSTTSTAWRSGGSFEC